MNEQFGPANPCEGRHHPARLLPLIVPLGIGFMLGMRKGMMHRWMHAEGGPEKRWENGVPPFFAELHRRAHAADQPATTEA